MATMTVPEKGAHVNHAGLPIARHAGNGGVTCPAAPVTADGSKERPAILALDLGTVTGWAMRAGDGAVISGTVSFRPSRYDGGGMRYLRFRGWLDELRRTTPELSAVYFEEVRRHAGTDAAHIFGGFLAHLTTWCEERVLPYQGVPVGTIKRHVAGKGNARKEAVIAAVRKRGFAPANHNEADALALLLWAIDTGGGVR